MAKNDRVGEDGLNDAQRRIDPDPDHWNDPTEKGPKTDDRGDTEIPANDKHS